MSTKRDVGKPRHVMCFWPVAFKQFISTYLTESIWPVTRTYTQPQSNHWTSVWTPKKSKVYQNLCFFIYLNTSGKEPRAEATYMLVKSVQWKYMHTHTRAHTRLTALCPGLARWAGTRKVKTIWILLKQEIVSGSGISWAICKSAPRSRQITMPAPHSSVF